MNTILIINGIASAIAGAGLAGVSVRARRAARRKEAVQPIYIPVDKARAPRR